MDELKNYVAEDGEYIIPVSWSVYSTITVKGVKNLDEAVKLAKEKANELPLSTETEYIDDSYKVNVDTEEDAIVAQYYAPIGNVVITEDGTIIS
jgi:hypothetical protein